MISSAYVSLFKTCFDRSPKADIHIFDFYSSIIGGEYHAEIDEIRVHPEKAQNLKKSLPCLTLSGTFSNRILNGLKQYSGRICIDIDAKENPSISDWNELRNTIGTWAEVEFVALSASGRGLFLTVPVRTPEKHLEHFESLKSVFSELGITIDSACSDITRLRFMTSDPYAILNTKAKPYCRTVMPLHKVMKAKSDKMIESCSLVEAAIQHVMRRNIDITEGYAVWYQIGCALVNVYGEKGRGFFHMISSFNPKYNRIACDKQFDKCLKNSKTYNAGTIIYYIRKYDPTFNSTNMLLQLFHQNLPHDIRPERL